MRYTITNLMLLAAALTLSAGITGELGLVAFTISIGVVAALAFCTAFLKYLNGSE